MIRILVVDDDAVGLDTITNFLETNGYICAKASNADEARHLLNVAQFDLIITDMHMPGESGLQLLNYAFAEFPHIVGIIITGENDSRIQRMALEVGVYAYVTKPFCHRKLLNCISNIDSK